MPEPETAERVMVEWNPGLRLVVVTNSASGDSVEFSEDAWQAYLDARREPSPGLMLREFHAAKAIHGGLMPERPTADVPDDIRDLRIALLDEEVEELRKAMLEGDLTEIADGIADVLFVAYGTAVPYGIPADEVFAEVHRSNMTKVNHTPKAKLTKGPGYEPPDIARVLGLAGENADA